MYCNTFAVKNLILMLKQRLLKESMKIPKTQKIFLKNIVSNVPQTFPLGWPNGKSVTPIVYIIVSVSLS